MTNNPITADVPFSKKGKHHGFLRLPHSRDDSAWGAVMIPITVVVNGTGPTALLTGANHGDEFEGPIVLQELSSEIMPHKIQGRIVIIPAMNYPAFVACKRTSPIDSGNMNRCFPGNAKGTTTEKIADYFNRVLLPMSDVVLDFHSGGKTLDFVPFAAAHSLENKQQEQRCMAAMMAFNAPYSMKMREIDSTGMYDTAAESQGKVFVTTELGGGGGASVRTINIARKGVHNFLKHAKILEGEPNIQQTKLLTMPDERCFVIAEDAGLLQPLVDLGYAVKKGQIIAKVWSITRTGKIPINYTAQLDGILAARHFPGLIQPGDCLAVVATKSTDTH